MARSDTVTLIPLDRLATILQIDPLHFNGVYSERRPLRNACDDVYFQHDYQYVGRTSRDSVAFALKQAEDAVAALLGYPLKPTWIVEESQQIDKVATTDAVGVGSINVRGMLKSVRSRWGNVVSTGRRALSEIDLAAPVGYSDLDLDGYKETATVVVLTTVTDPQEIAVFYPNKLGSPKWQIRPINVSIVAGTATITFRREQAVLEAEMEKLTDLDAANPTVDGDNDVFFLTTVDVYREYNDPSQPAVMYTEGSCSSCDGSGCDACGYVAETACLGLRDPRLGILTYNRADWDAVNAKFVAAGFASGREPDRIKLWYRAGLRDMSQDHPLLQMDTTYERMVVYYAMTLLDSEVPGCSNTRKITEYYQYDLAASRAVGNEASSTQLSDADLRCPLGTTRAAIKLWKYIQTDSGRLVTAR